MKRTISIILFVLAVITAVAQRVTFHSPQFEFGVKSHLGLDSAAVVMQQQTDTIQRIDLSGLGISDIRDVVYLPNIKDLNLSYNSIADISPLISLDSLHTLDIRANELDNADLLAFCSSDSMTVHLAYNYISDFKRLLLPGRCRLNVAGMSAQIIRSATYLDVYRLYTDFDEQNKLKVFYRGYANTNLPRLICSGKEALAITDGDLHECDLPGAPKKASLLYLTDGVRGDSTWVIPQQRFSVKAGEELTIATGLPNDYSVFYVSANKGSATQSGVTLTYQAPLIIEPDTISFTYYQGSKLRGVGKYLINIKDDPVDIADLNAIINMMLGIIPQTDAGDVTGDGNVDISDVNAVINIILGKDNPAIPDVEPTAQPLTGTGYSAPDNTNTRADEAYTKLVDGDKKTKWCIVYGTGAWQTIHIDFESAAVFVPTQYILTTGNDTETHAGRNPKKWKLYGKANQNDTWTVLSDVSDGAAAGMGTANTTDYTFVLQKNTKPYRYFRFEVSELCGKDDYSNKYIFQLAELQLMGVPLE